MPFNLEYLNEFEILKTERDVDAVLIEKHVYRFYKENENKSICYRCENYQNKEKPCKTSITLAICEETRKLYYASKSTVHSCLALTDDEIGRRRALVKIKEELKNTCLKKILSNSEIKLIFDQHKQNYVKQYGEEAGKKLLYTSFNKTLSKMANEITKSIGLTLI